MAGSAEIKVISSQAIKEAYLAFAPEFERVSGHKLNTTWNGTNDILKKLRAGETFDMAILVTPAMEAMIKEGKIVGSSRVDLVRSGIAIAVPKGVPKPDISTADAVKRLLLAAKGIGYSSGPSGVFLESLFKKWGIWDQVAAKITQTPPGTPVGSILARGDVISASSRSASSCCSRASSMSVRCRRRWTPSACLPAAFTPARRRRTPHAS
ncbi:MAG: substrate-binding domain-containing protein [Xanthobacteraceae bacterium]|nr:substrate-binding domain-containing protein [Xanthobacteraceae bacterium]